MKTFSEHIDNLVVSSQNGDSDAFTLLYEEYLTSIYRFCIFRLPSQEIAEDITSEVFLTVWKNIKLYKKTESIPFSAWVFRIAQNKIIDFFRKNHETCELLEDLFVVDENSENSRKEVENFYLRKELQKALSHIPESQAESLILKYFSDLDNKEIAQIMGKSETAVRILQSRGIKALKPLLKTLQQDFF